MNPGFFGESPNAVVTEPWLLLFSDWFVCQMISRKSALLKADCFQYLMQLTSNVSGNKYLQFLASVRFT